MDIVNPFVPYTYDKIINDIELLKTQYKFLKTGLLGKTYFGRDIPYIKLGNGSEKLIICASVHAREYITSSYVMELTEVYAFNYAENLLFGKYNVKGLLDIVSLWIVPMVNPDGVTIVNEPHKANIKELSKLTGRNMTGGDFLLKWKANGLGVDLNNNFDCAWQAMNKDAKSPSYMGYKGISPDSEYETKALEGLCRAKKFNAALSFHAKGEVIYWADDLSKNYIHYAEKLTDDICELTGYSKMPCTKDINSYGGGFENWFRKEFRAPALCIELTPDNKNEKPHDSSLFDKIVWDKAKYIPLEAISSLKSKYPCHC